MTKYTYNADSLELETVADSSGGVTKIFYDDLGRTAYIAENYDNFDPATLSTIGDGTDTSKDRVTQAEYNGLGRTTRLTAYNGSSSADEVTLYLYENAVDAGRMTNEIYPDSTDTASSGTDQVKMVYSVDGQVTQRTDQRGVVIASSYENLRRPKSQKVTSLGSGGVDGTVRSITWSYDNLGRVAKITSHGNQTDDPNDTTDVKNQIVLTYNDLGQVTKSEQSHSGVVGMGTNFVQYAYDTSAVSSVFDDGARLESVTYPSGRVIFNDYGTADGFTDRSHIPYRLRETNGSGTILTEYSYNGSVRPVVVDYPVPDIKLDLFRGTTGTYAGLDRFGRTVDQYWDGYGTTADVDRFKYAYDYAGNRTYRDIDSAIYATNNKDQAYTYDNLHRLDLSQQGTLLGSTISGTPVREEDWTLDALGNFSNYLTKANGTTTLNQPRTHSDANEVTAFNGMTGVTNHDKAGNTTAAPRVDSWLNSNIFYYDAWNRLVNVQGGGSNLVKYKYDGRNYRIAKDVYTTGGVVSYTDHTYYNENWQALEVRRETSGTEDSDPREQFVWNPEYIDSLAVRYYDSDTDANLAELSDGTHYYTHDANYNVTGIANASGTILERFQYDPYGKMTVLDANFANDADNKSDVDNEVTYTGRNYDVKTSRYHFRNRDYDPITGRFLRRDPIGYAGGDNLYRYVLANPVNFTDPSGELLPVIGIAVIGITYFFWPNTANAPAPGDPTTPGDPNGGIGPAACGALGGKLAANLIGSCASWCAKLKPKPICVGPGPSNLAEQLVMEDALAGGGSVIMKGPFGDPLYQGAGWVKMQVVHDLPDGTHIVVHYMKNTITGKMAQCKFK